jgi:sulfite exporter TauE/SafE
VATAGATASASVGALVMAGFWLGTLPVMSGVGVVAQALTGPIRRRLPALTAATLIVVGLLTIAGKFQPGRAAATVCHAPAEAEAGHGPR